MKYAPGVVVFALAVGCGESDGSDGQSMVGAGGDSGGGNAGGDGGPQVGGTAGAGSGGQAGSTSSAPFTFSDPEVLASDLAFPIRLVLADNYLYYGNRGGSGSTALGTVARVATGGGSTELLASGEGGPAGVHVQSGFLYWANANSGELRRRALSGGTAQTVVTMTGSTLAEVAGNAERLYVSNLSQQQVLVLDAATGTGSAISVQASTTRIFVTPSRIHFNDQGDFEAATGAIYEANLDGSGARPLVGNLAVPEGISVRDGVLYFAALGAFAPGQNTPTVSGGVYRMNLSGSTPEELVSSASEPFAIALDDRYIYFTERSQNSAGDPAQCDTPTGRLLALPLGGGQAEVVAQGLVCPSTIVVTDTAVFWVNNGDSVNYGTGTVMRVAKERG